jgi:murein DD-endopeptidase MepM/ murein hydrolase activator NlpD
VSLSPSAVYALARSAGFDPSTAAVMVAIAGAESGWNPVAVGDAGLADDTWGPSIGLWQIRSLRAQTGTGRERDASRLTDPAFNARAAFTIYKQQGLRAWSTYSNGRFRNYLGQATAASVGGAVDQATSGAGLSGAIVPGATIGARFGDRGSMWSHTGGRHTGIDLMAAAGTPIYARAGGTVKRADYAVGSYGNHVQVQVDARTLMIYAHMRDTPKVRKGQKITAGTQLGVVGQTGNAKGNHCHFEVRIDGKPVDPTRYLTGGTVPTVPSSWDSSATVDPAGLDLGGALGDAADGVWQKVKPALFTLLFAGAGAGIVLTGLAITALPPRD